MAISHADHDHPNTPAARAACRKRMNNGQSPRNESAERALAEAVGIINKPAQMTVVPRTKRDGGVVKGMKAAAPKNTKKTGTLIKDIGDLPDVPRMLAYGVKMAWAVDWEARVGDPFNDNEARVVIQGESAEIALVWRPSLPDGVWGVFVRNWDSSITYRVDSVQEAFTLAADREGWDENGNKL